VKHAKTGMQANLNEDDFDIVELQWTDSENGSSEVASQESEDSEKKN
jgi:hypothetical protein